MGEANVLVGFGNMGGALARGWCARGVAAADITVVEPADVQAATARAEGFRAVAGAEALDPGLAPACVVFAVKPQVMDSVVPEYARLAGSGAVFLSIAAGKTLASLQGALGAGAAVVRAMPNLPATVGRGTSVACANDAVDAAGRAACTELLAAVGEVAWIEDESLLDAVTGVSGSGPAYVFLLIECLAAAGVEAGLPEALALDLARATVAGAGELARRSDETAAALRRRVTSPGGTTQAALEVLMGEAGLAPLIRDAVEAAAARSRELALG